MKIYGSFYDIDNNKITVTIISDNGNDGELVIGSKDSGIWFDGEDPIVIEQDNSDTFQTIIKTSCEIRLQITKPLDIELFAYGKRSVSVSVTKNDNCIFLGFVEPNTYSQGFAYPIESFSLNCIDALSSIQYDNYNGINANNFVEKQYDADNKSFKDIILNIFDEIRTINGISTKIYYQAKWDVNKKEIGSYTSFLQKLEISELNFIGVEFDDVQTNEDVLDSILQYLNLHIMQYGNIFYIFHWDMIRNMETYWYELDNNKARFLQKKKIPLKSAMHSDSDTNFSIDEVYNQIQVNCDINSQDTVITSPMDSDTYEDGKYRYKQHYCREYISEGEGRTSFEAFKNIVNKKNTDYDACKTVDWYFRVVDNKFWKLHINPNGDEIQSIYETDSQGKYTNMWKVPEYVFDNKLTPLLIQMGSVEKAGGPTQDDEPVSKVSMTDYLVISINGNGSDTNPEPTDEELETNQGFIEYIGNSTGGMLSPADPNTTNYLVFSGNILLQPRVQESGWSNRFINYFSMLYPTCQSWDMVFGKTVPSANNEDGRYYTRQFFKNNDSEWIEGKRSLNPYCDDKTPKELKFEYSSIGDSSDKISRLDVLECQLIVGNKICSGNSTDGFKWIENNSTNSGATIILSVNPKIGDYIIGQEHHIANTLTIEDGIDAEGTAIPITKFDGLSGQIRFKILGPVNNYWDKITRRHPTWFRHTKWSQNAVSVLSKVQNIYIKDFKCEIYSNGGGLETLSDKDLVYVSNENHKFVEKKDDIDFKIATQLTSEEAYELGIKPTVNMNSPSLNVNGTVVPFVGMYDMENGEYSKPEKFYVDSYYREYSQPRYLLETTLHNNGDIEPFNIYTSTPLKCKMFMVNYSYNVKNNEKTVTLKSYD